MKFIILFASLLAYAHGQYETVKSIEALGAAASNQFGITLAANGDFFAATEYVIDGGTVGKVSLYGKDTGGVDNWGVIKAFTEPAGGTGGNLLISALVMTETTLVIGDYSHDGSAGADTGILYIYERDNGGVDNWGFVTSIEGTVVGQDLGRTDRVSLDGDTLVACTIEGFGECWVYGRDTGGASNWGLDATISGPAVADTLFAERVNVRGDRVYVSAPAFEPSGQGTNEVWGAMYMYDRDSGGVDNWGNVLILTPTTVNAGVAGTIENSDYFFRYFDVTADGSLLVVGDTREDDTLTDVGRLVVFGKDTGGVDNWGIVATVANPNPYTNVQWGQRALHFSPDGLSIMVGQHRLGSAAGPGTLEFFDKGIGGTDQWGLVQTVEIADSTAIYGDIAIFGGDSVFTSDKKFDDPTGNNDVGRVVVLAIPPCANSAECDTGKYCAVPDLECAATVCTVNADCFGLFITGRLPFCNTDTGFCEDKYAGTCTSMPGCNTKVGRLVSAETSIGSVSQTVTTTNTTAAREAVKKLNTDILSGTTTTNDIYTYIVAEETATLDSAIFEEINDDVVVLGHIKSVVCGDIGEDLCTVVIPARQLLGDHHYDRELGVGIVVSVSYEVDAEAFALLENDGSFSDPSFVSALAAAAGVGVGNVTVNIADGSFSIEYTVTDEAVGGDPLTEESLAAISELQGDIGTITATVISELGLDSGDVSTASVDYCSGRDCNARGTCDEGTGVCNCTDTGYWGINCETAVDCHNGVPTTADGAAYCECDYPEFGQRCNETQDCTC
jgi:hypothetical protein